MVDTYDQLKKKYDQLKERARLEEYDQLKEFVWGHFLEAFFIYDYIIDFPNYQLLAESEVDFPIWKFDILPPPRFRKFLPWIRFLMLIEETTEIAKQRAKSKNPAVPDGNALWQIRSKQVGQDLLNSSSMRDTYDVVLVCYGYCKDGRERELDSPTTMRTDKRAYRRIGRVRPFRDYQEELRQGDVKTLTDLSADCGYREIMPMFTVDNIRRLVKREPFADFQDPDL